MYREQYLEKLVPHVLQIRAAVREYGPDAIQAAIDEALAVPAPDDQNPVTAVICLLAIIDGEMAPSSCVWRVLAGRHVELQADLGLGRGAAVVLTADLGPGYIEENMRTS